MWRGAAASAASQSATAAVYSPFLKRAVARFVQNVTFRSAFSGSIMSASVYFWIASAYRPAEKASFPAFFASSI